MIVFFICSIQYAVYADSSVLMDSITYFYGNVDFKHKDITITSEKAVLFKDKIIAQDSVHITQGDLEIFSELGEYRWNKDIRLFNGFHASKINDILTGDRGRCFEDTLWIYGNAVYINNNEKFKVSGDYGLYKFNEHSGIITGNPIFDTLEDSIKITGDTIKFFGDTLTQVVQNAVIKLEEMQGFADSVIYHPSQEIAHLYGTPFITSQTDSLGGKQIKIVLKERKVESMIVQGEVWGKRIRD